MNRKKVIELERLQRLGFYMLGTAYISIELFETLEEWCHVPTVGHVDISIGVLSDIIFCSDYPIYIKLEMSSVLLVNELREHNPEFCFCDSFSDLYKDVNGIRPYSLARPDRENYWTCSNIRRWHDAHYILNMNDKNYPNGIYERIY
jgi:hypothetical protein